MLLSLARHIMAGLGTVATKLATDGRGASVKHSGDGSLAQALKLAKLDRDAFFNTEFLIRHGDTVPDWSGVVLSSFHRHESQKHLSCRFNRSEASPEIDTEESAH